MTMNIKLTTLYLSGVLALTSFVARPLLADEWNKRTEFQFSAPDSRADVGGGEVRFPTCRQRLRPECCPDLLGGFFWPRKPGYDSTGNSGLYRRNSAPTNHPF